MCARAVNVLTNFAPPHDSALLHIQSLLTGAGLEKLDEAVRLFDGDLGQLAILVENMEEITLGDPLRGKIACSRERTTG